MKRIIIFLFVFGTLFGQDLEVTKVEPPNWWINHSYNTIQLLVYGKNLDNVNVRSRNENLIVKSVDFSDNNNYAFVNLIIKNNTKAGSYKLIFENDFGTKEINYTLFERECVNDKHNGFSNDDVIYLIFPDRFVNGNSENDFLMNDKEEFEFKGENGRYGGDIEGIISKLDYLKNLGVTAIWSTPLLENNMYMSYHGYAATDFYKIDPRHGTNDLYKKFVNEAHKKGLKVIYDHVTNHIGLNHEWVNNPPTKTWFHGSTSNHLPANHNKMSYVDIHSTEQSKQLSNEGWFVNEMPDLNQRDPKLAKYIIQNTIWWIEYSGIDGIREDTYPYANQKFMSKWAETILKHYPKFNIVGEVWKGEPAVLAAFQKGSYFPKEFDSNLPVVTDFAFRDAVAEYMSGEKDLNNVYQLLGKDFVYKNPSNLLVFFDNHDIDRGYYIAKGNLNKYLVGITLVLTTRGIPQIFYGTEIGLNGGGHHHKIRAPFPGGFPGDQNNAFEEKGRTTKQNKIFHFTQKLLKLRKKYSALRTGKLTQFQPKDGVFHYLRSDNDSNILIILNDSNEKKIFDVGKKLYNLVEVNGLQDLLSDKSLNKKDSEVLYLQPTSINIFKIN